MSDALNGNIHGPVVAATEEGDESASFGLSGEVTYYAADDYDEISSSFLSTVVTEGEAGI